MMRDENNMTAIAALANAYGIKNEDVHIIRTLGGMTNRNFLCEAGGERYVVRIPGEGTAQMINRHTERMLTWAAVEHGWHPQLVHIGDDGVKITRYVANAETLTPATAASSAGLRDVARILKELHSSDIEPATTFNVFDELEKYKQMLQNAQATTAYPAYAAVENALPAVAKRLQQLGELRRPCHNDLVPENWLRAPERLYLLDWEYAGWNDPAWDLAAFMSECALSESARRELLDCYRPEGERAYWEEKVLIYELLQHALWFVWTLVKAEHGVHFAGYAELRLNGAVAALAKGNERYAWSL